LNDERWHAVDRLFERASNNRQSVAWRGSKPRLQTMNFCVVKLRR
jgi:hypothetical protein